MPIFFTGRAGKAAAGRKPAPAAPSIRGEPQSPPTFSSLPSNWSPTVHVSNLERVDWAVFRVSVDGQYTTDMSWQRVARPAGAGASWSFVPAATIQQQRDRLVVKDDGLNPTVEWASDGAAVATATGGGGGGTGDATRIDVMLRGQSNAYLAAAAGADDLFAQTLSALCGVPVNLISRREQGTGDNTQHSSTSTAWVDPYDWSFGTWLRVPGGDYDTSVETRAAIDYSSDPATWTAQGPMAETVAAVQRFRSGDPTALFVDLRLHQEYDWVMYYEAQPHYRAMAWEVTRRVRAATGLPADRCFPVYLHCPYTGKTLRAVQAVAQAWAADAAERGAVLAGNMMDATSSDGGSHWDAEGPNRSFPRLALQVAKALWDAGRLPASSMDLSDAPGPGPRMASASRVTARRVSVAVAHDRGSSLMAQGSNGIDWGAFTWEVGDEHGADAVSGRIAGPGTIELDFPDDIPSTGAERLRYCAWPGHRGDRLIVDDWHRNRPAKYNAVPNIGAVVFPLRRDPLGVAF